MHRSHTSGSNDLPVVSAAIHAGHALREEIADVIELDPATRLREEDPYTDHVIRDVGTAVAVDRSRFEVDLNRDRDSAVYRRPEDAWGLDVWRVPLTDEATERSLAQHDAFYARLESMLDELAHNGPFLLLDVHSYNHRRGGPTAAPEPVADNPEVNVGTGSLEGGRWRDVVDCFLDELGRCEVRGHPLDVRENVRFRGGHLSRWVNRRYPQHGCALAIELKKTFMDEWTGAPDDEHLADLGDALARTATRTVDTLIRTAAR